MSTQQTKQVTKRPAKDDTEAPAVTSLEDETLAAATEKTLGEIDDVLAETGTETKPLLNGDSAYDDYDAWMAAQRLWLSDEMSDAELAKYEQEWHAKWDNRYYLGCSGLRER
jgi:hypothetical protein